uniref:Uncharacterized protein n=1 Tax=Glossina austeni TaxID=7395 RepID=A0A1A9V0W2_GLOAU
MLEQATFLGVGHMVTGVELSSTRAALEVPASSLSRLEPEHFCRFNSLAAIRSIIFVPRSEVSERRLINFLPSSSKIRRRSSLFIDIFSILSIRSSTVNSEDESCCPCRGGVNSMLSATSASEFPRLMRTARSSCGSSSKPITLSLAFAFTACFSTLRRLEDLEVRSAPVGVVSSSLERTEDGIVNKVVGGRSNVTFSSSSLKNLFSTAGINKLSKYDSHSGKEKGQYKEVVFNFKCNHVRDTLKPFIEQSKDIIFLRLLLQMKSRRIPILLPSLPSAQNNAALSLVLLMLFQSIFTSSTSGVVELELWQLLLLFCWLLSLLTLACSTNSNNNFGNVASSLQLSSLTANSFNRARFSSNMAVNLSMSKLFLPLKPNTI